MMWFILLMAVIAAVYGLGVAALVALIVIGAVLADRN